MLEIKDLTVRYGPVTALKGVSLTVRQGEIVSIIGANGAGKSTLVRTVSGLVRAGGGSIHFEGRDITSAPSHLIVRAGLVQVPEGRMVLAKLTVLDNLLAAAAVRARQGDVRDDLERAMQRFPVLRERAAQLAGSLSGGQQQMLVIARALMARPRLLLLDEPSLGLAPVISSQVFEIISDIRKEGVTVLLIEQNARKALSIADRGYVIELGQLVLEGPAARLADDPRVIEAYLGG
jgi:branched-chain amino acid transport system ATP-binding protein